MQKSHPKVVNPRDIAGERKKKKKKKNLHPNTRWWCLSEGKAAELNRVATWPSPLSPRNTSFGHVPHLIVFYYILGCIIPLQEVALCQSPPTFSVLCPLCSLLPHNVSLQWCFGLPTHLTLFVCHSVLLMVQLLSFSRAMCSAHFQFTLMYSTMAVALVLCQWWCFLMASLNGQSLSRRWPTIQDVLPEQ